MAETGAAEPGPAPPALPRRVLDVFVSPGRLTEALAARPVWAGALVLGAAVVVLQIALIPAEVWDTVFRELMLQQGQTPPEEGVGGSLMRVWSVVAGSVAWVLMTFLAAGLITVLFAFVLGDEGRYAQYLAILAHAWLIPAFVGLALVPLRVSLADPQLVLSVGLFFPFLEEGYAADVLGFLDLAQLWALLVVAEGAHAIEPRRSFGSAAALLLVLTLILAMALAPLAP